MPGNRGISFERLVGACVENVETVSDSQEADDSAGDGFKAAQPHTTENDRKEETKRAVGESK
jgi:hypothetical protein